MTHDNQVRFPAENAFVIQFAEPRAAGEPRPARVEHITSGRARRFQDATELMAFVAEVLTSLHGDHLVEPGDPQPEPRVSGPLQRRRS